jgi:hypothetical protein
MPVKKEMEKEMPEVEIKVESKETPESPSVEQADCCMCCMSYQPGRMDTGVCTRHRTGTGMMETKDTNVCSEFMSKGGEKEEVEE